MPLTRTPIAPIGLATTLAASTGTAHRVQVTSLANGTSVLLSWTGATYAHTRFGDSGVTIPAAGIPIPPGGQLLVQAPGDGSTYVACKALSGTGSLYVLPCEGDAY